MLPFLQVRGKSFCTVALITQAGGEADGETFEQLKAWKNILRILKVKSTISSLMIVLMHLPFTYMYLRLRYANTQVLVGLSFFMSHYFSLIIPRIKHCHYKTLLAAETISS